MRFLGVTLGVLLLGPAPMWAQVRADRAIREAGVEHYFADSLATNRLRMLRGTTLDTVGGNATLTGNVSLVTRVDTTPRIEAVGGDLRIVLPERAFGSDVNTGAYFLRPVVLVEGGGLSYAASRRGFRTTLRVGLEDSLNVAPRSIPTGLRDFFLFGEVDSIVPADVRVERSQLPYQPVEVFAASPLADSVAVQVRTNLSTVRLSIPVNRVNLGLAVSPVRVQGFGLESTKVRLGPVATGAGLAAPLAANIGNLSTTLVELDERGAGATMLRSSGVGTDTVHLRSGVFRGRTVAVEYVFPFLFLGAALIGGLIGSMARGLLKDRIVAPAPMLGGVLIGLIVAAAYTVGINLVGLQPTVTTGQIVVSVFAGIGGFFGASILERLSIGTG